MKDTTKEALLTAKAALTRAAAACMAEAMENEEKRSQILRDGVLSLTGMADSIEYQLLSARWDLQANSADVPRGAAW